MCLVAWTGRQALKARDALESAAVDFQHLGSQLSSGDVTGARRTLADAQQHARAARANTHGPGWWLTSRIPGVGANVTAVRTVSGVVDDLSRDVLPAVVRASGRLDPSALQPSHGQVDLRPLSEVAAPLAAANARLQRETRIAQDISTDGLAPQIAAPVEMLQNKLGAAAALSDRASRAVRLLPSMLGADGPRTYLMLFQNNAEVRATGGIPGAFATIRADHGRVTIGRQGDAATIGRFTSPPLRLTAEERSLFTSKLGIFPQDVNFTPDFPRSAALVKAMWEAHGNPQVDGVLSVDPVALSYVLNGTGPVRLADGTSLTAGTAVRRLLSSVYLHIADPQQQNAYFASVARHVFSAFSAGQGDPRDVLRELTRATDERRILLWSTHPREQHVIAPTELSGALATGPSPTPHIGVYLNDATAAKMDYYLGYSTKVKARRCQASRQYLTVTVSMHSHAPADAAGLPAYVRGEVPGIPRGVTRTNVMLYAPTGGYVRTVSVDDRDQPFDTETHDGRPVVLRTVDLRPGQSHTLTYEVVSGRGQTDPVSLRVTPGANGPGVTGVPSGSACP